MKKISTVFRSIYLVVLFFFISCNSNNFETRLEEEELKAIKDIFSDLFLLKPPIPKEDVIVPLSRCIYIYESLVMAREAIMPIEERKISFTREFRPLLDQLISLKSRKVAFSTLQISEEVDIKSVNSLGYRDHPFYILSRISFNKHFNKGILYLQNACYGCSYSELIAINKVRERWHISTRVNVSME